MRLSIQFKPNKRIHLEFGYKTPLFEGMYWFTIVIVDLDFYGQVDYASIVLAWFKHPKYWFNSWGKKPLYAPYEPMGDDSLLYDCYYCGGLNGEHVDNCPCFI